MSVQPGRSCGQGLALLAAVVAGSALADEMPTRPVWPDTPLARAEALALLQSLNADLLGHDSATLTLERWCQAHGMASPARITAERVHGVERPIPADLRAQLAIGPREPLKYRRVALRCGGRVLSEADNWYVPARLTAAMNRALDSTDQPFGKVVRPLHFRRRTLSSKLLWSPLPPGWEMRPSLPAGGAGALAIPHALLQHRALLADPQWPFSAVIETYTAQVLAFPLPALSVPLPSRAASVVPATAAGESPRVHR